MRSRLTPYVPAVLALGLLASIDVLGQQPSTAVPVPSRIPQAISSTSLVALPPSVSRNLVSALVDFAAEDSQPLRLLLLPQRSTAQQAVLGNLIARKQQQGAPDTKIGLRQKSMALPSVWQART